MLSGGGKCSRIRFDPWVGLDMPVSLDHRPCSFSEKWIPARCSWAGGSSSSCHLRPTNCTIPSNLVESCGPEGAGSPSPSPVGCVLKREWCLPGRDCFCCSGTRNKYSACALGHSVLVSPVPPLPFISPALPWKRKVRWKTRRCSLAPAMGPRYCCGGPPGRVCLSVVAQSPRHSGRGKTRLGPNSLGPSRWNAQDMAML